MRRPGSMVSTRMHHGEFGNETDEGSPPWQVRTAKCVGVRQRRQGSPFSGSRDSRHRSSGTSAPGDDASEVGTRSRRSEACVLMVSNSVRRNLEGHQSTWSLRARRQADARRLSRCVAPSAWAFETKIADGSGGFGSFGRRERALVNRTARRRRRWRGRSVRDDAARIARDRCRRHAHARADTLIPLRRCLMR